VNSQSAYHAVILDKPVILANLEAFPELPLLARYGAAAEATDGVILFDLVRELLAGGPMCQRLAHGRRQLVEAYFRWEHASENIADLIERLATQSRSGA
jgi:glycosyltransferase involved in cell wall biosynthesis